MQARTLLSALIFAGCACDAGSHGTDAGRPAPSPPATPDAQETVVREWLRAQAVSETHFGVSVLYAWLSDDEADAVRDGGSVTAVDDGISTELDAVLASPTCDVEHQLTAMHPTRRATWPAPWPIRRGWSDDAPGGEHLARVELRPESLLAIIDTRTTPHAIRFATDHGVEAPLGEALLVPELWAAVLVVAPRSRAYFLIAPALVRRVSLGSPEIASELRTDRDRILGLARHVADTEHPLETSDLTRAWSTSPGPRAGLDELLAAAIPSGDRIPSGRRGLTELARGLLASDPPYEWRTTIASEPRPQFFE